MNNVSVLNVGTFSIISLGLWYRISKIVGIKEIENNIICEIEKKLDGASIQNNRK